MTPRSLRTTLKMDNCTKLKLFNLLLILCVVNFFLYRFFANSHHHLGTVSMNEPGDNNIVLEVDSAPSIQNIEFPSSISSSSTHDIGSSIREATVADRQDPANDLNKESATGKIEDVQKLDQSTDTAADAGDEAVIDSQSKLTPGNQTLGDLPNCPVTPPGLIGRLATFREAQSFEEIGRENPEVRLGGLYTPRSCTALHRVAVVVPYRNREEHLKILVRNLHPMLQRQQLDYGIFIIDQALPGRFNRAMLMNIGFVEAMKRHDYQCAIFHDVDLIPEDDRNIYSCPQQPRHLSASIDKFNYKLPYAGIYGGVSAINKRQFHELNGFSNLYFGWGGEDDDMAKRLSMKGYKITRYPMQIARYKMIQHKHEKFNEVNPKRFELLRTTSSRQPWDGLNSLVYTVQKVEELPTHTRIQVLIREEDVPTKP
ncbi:hypothetical protein EGW08_001792 [Elysia chlorotica]|uniref:Beta-1,4-galactosyltransferase n=1 Tax=Elysia chlorotica TaxID=188477 RepID=A0A3S0ZZD4_ELYCH|nr:hypothetical protein EGW08_001792 [Elysia chlorotica]